MKALPAIDLSCGFDVTLTPSRRSSSALSIAPRSPTPAGAYVSSTCAAPTATACSFTPTCSPGQCARGSRARSRPGRAIDAVSGALDRQQFCARDLLCQRLSVPEREHRICRAVDHERGNLIEDNGLEGRSSPEITLWFCRAATLSACDIATDELTRCRLVEGSLATVEDAGVADEVLDHRVGSGQSTLAVAAKRASPPLAVEALGHRVSQEWC